MKESSRKIYLRTGTALIAMAACIGVLWLSFSIDSKQAASPANQPPANQQSLQGDSPSKPAEQNTPPSQPSTSEYADPIDDFKARITKKPFGIQITPSTSPVQPEKFSGFHTGVDVEYTDITTSVPVRAIADGTVVSSQWVSGYGGVTLIRHTINGQPRLALYGHLKPSRLPAVGSNVTRGQEIGELGIGYTFETDNERKHLHFAILAGTDINLRGYTPTQAGLASWIDPMTLYP